MLFAGNQIQANLPLQIALYFNVGIFPLWFIIIIVNLDAKVNIIKFSLKFIYIYIKYIAFNNKGMLFFMLQYYYLTDVYKVITIAVFIVISTLESLRLYLGYLGNLAEKVAYVSIRQVK